MDRNEVMILQPRSLQDRHYVAFHVGYGTLNRGLPLQPRISGLSMRIKDAATGGNDRAATVRNRRVARRSDALIGAAKSE